MRMSTRSRAGAVARAMLIATVAIGMAGVFGPVATAVAAAPCGGPADYDGDGFHDLAVGVPFEDVGSIRDAGAVQVLYGSAAGLSARDQLFHQNTSGIAGTAESGDEFGTSVASGDFDGDGKTDLAIGVPGEGLGGVSRAGLINVLYGTSSGLSAAGDQVFTQNSAGSGGGEGAESSDFFGTAMVAADFDGDGKEDLAIAALGETVSSHVAAGAVTVLYGSASGLTSTGSLYLTQDDLLGIASDDEQFGIALAACDFDGDSFGDLAIGALDDGGGTQRGSVHVVYGTGSGLDLSAGPGKKSFTQADITGAGGVESGAKFGAALAAGDFNNDGDAELAIGIPQDNVGGKTDVGTVGVLIGSGSGLGLTTQWWHQDIAGVAGGAEGGDRFGESLAAGDFDGDGNDDLAIGVPRENIGSIVDSGMVNVLYGSGSGLTANGDQVWFQGSPGVAGGVETGDQFGLTLWASDASGDGAADLIIGAPLEDIGSRAEAGAITTLIGASGLTAAGGGKGWSQNTAGIQGGSESGDRFGAALG